MVDRMSSGPGVAEADTTNSTSLTSLVTGIVKDMQELTRQQLTLFKEETKEDLRKTRDVAISWAAGMAAAMVASIMLAITLAQLLYWAFPTVLPLWVCYLIVTCILAIAGGALVYAGKKKLESFNPLPDQSVRALKENVQCLTNPR